MRDAASKATPGGAIKVVRQLRAHADKLASLHVERARAKAMCRAAMATASWRPLAAI